jgi:uncharacterized lipoprotein YmbA
MVALLAALAACASAPELDHYTIDMTPSGRVQAVTNLEVNGVVVSDKLAQRRIVIHLSPTRIETYANARWASGVRQMVEQKLAAELGAPAADGRRLVLDGAVTAFEQVDGSAGPQARVGLDMEIRDHGSNRSEPPLLEKTYEVLRPAATDSVDGVVQALSRCLEEIAAEIAEDAAGL